MPRDSPSSRSPCESTDRTTTSVPVLPRLWRHANLGTRPGKTPPESGLRGCGSSDCAITLSSSPGASSSRASASRSACSRTAGCSSSSALVRSSMVSARSPASDHKASSRACGTRLPNNNCRSGATADESCRSNSSRWAVSRHQPCGLSKAATSSPVVALPNLRRPRILKTGRRKPEESDHSCGHS